ncbi:MAG: hypothetical protein JWL76_607 [Thermoleophilia bacterium]|nr:hypothetical protein [Thermoleophilia bacterium]
MSGMAVGVRGSSNDNLTTGLLIGGGTATAAGVGVGGHAIWARTHVADRQQRLADANASLVGANQHETEMRSALAADRVHPPAGTSADDALAWARSRFASGAGTAYTREGTGADLDISRWGSPTGSSGEAISGARTLSDGNAGGVVRAGDWHIPVRFAQDLDPLAKSRQVSYQETVWEYHSGPNPAHNNQYEYHYGPHEVTKYRTEHYLDEFTRFRANHDGLDAAFTDDFDDLRHIGTRPERAVEDAVSGVAQATDEVADATRSLGYATGKSGMVRNISIGVALVGAGALAAGLVRSSES